jgi:hypothetical protein
MFALPPKADIGRAHYDVRFVPIADIGVPNHALRWHRYARKEVSRTTAPTNKKTNAEQTSALGWKLIDSQESFARVAVFLATCTVGVVLWPRVRIGKGI